MEDVKVVGSAHRAEEEEEAAAAEQVTELSYDDDAWIDGGGDGESADVGEWPEEEEKSCGARLEAAVEKKADPAQQRDAQTRMRVHITAVLDEVWAPGIYVEERLLGRLHCDVTDEERAAFRREAASITYMVAEEKDQTPAVDDLVRLRSVTDNGTVLHVYLVEELYTWLSNSNKDPCTGRAFAVADLDDIWRLECARSRTSKPRLDVGQKQDASEYEAALNAQQFAELAEQDARESKMPRSRALSRFAPYRVHAGRSAHSAHGAAGGGGAYSGGGGGGGGGGESVLRHSSRRPVESHTDYDLAPYLLDAGGGGDGTDKGDGDGKRGHVDVQSQQQELWDRLRERDAYERAIAVALALSLKTHQTSATSSVCGDKAPLDTSVSSLSTLTSTVSSSSSTPASPPPPSATPLKTPKPISNPVRRPSRPDRTLLIALALSTKLSRTSSSSSSTSAPTSSQ